MTCSLCNRAPKQCGPLSPLTIGNTTVTICGECAGAFRLVERLTEKLQRQAEANDDAE